MVSELQRFVKTLHTKKRASARGGSEVDILKTCDHSPHALSDLSVAPMEEERERWASARDAALAAARPPVAADRGKMAQPLPPPPAAAVSRVLRGEGSAADVAALQQNTRADIWLFVSGSHVVRIPFSPRIIPAAPPGRFVQGPRMAPLYF